MTYHDRDTMPPRGGAAVGHLSELPRLEAAAICYLRLWCAGTEGRDELMLAFTDLAPTDAAQRAEGFAELVRLMLETARRPLQRRHLGCACVSGDECAFGHMVACAAMGEREEAMLLASLLVQPDAWLPLSLQAERIGLEIAQMHVPAPNMTRATHTAPSRKPN
ncbi:hypothetical protein SAMN06273572_105249 [Monaibacterium marinum]|uniref:Uncharacterized protein n=1 Tax=Pontivivens marinum TaxID=1690039 RepID=A0A2C9CUD1_9RHOB|nr:hypothetical protein [Monaibacterium marinum]SOH94823.1 hypothetical protein SAMN06273572_105249 [Monaibacterium marinum]